jgi:hypothetical protein
LIKEFKKTLIYIANPVNRKDSGKEDKGCKIVCKSLSKLNLKDVADKSLGPNGPKPTTSEPTKKTSSAVVPKVEAVEKKPS